MITENINFTMLTVIVPNAFQSRNNIQIRPNLRSLLQNQLILTGSAKVIGPCSDGQHWLMKMFSTASQQSKYH